MRLVVLFSFLASRLISLGQIEFNYSDAKDGRLTSIAFDTLLQSTIVYVKSNAKIYFKQADVANLLKRKGRADTTKALDNFLINEASKRWHTIIIDKLYGGNNIPEWKFSTFEGKVNGIFEYVAADLILEGKFMIYNTKGNGPINQGLYVRKKKRRHTGNTYLEFRLPANKTFLAMPISFKEVVAH